MPDKSQLRKPEKARTVSIPGRFQLFPAFINLKARNPGFEVKPGLQTWNELGYSRKSRKFPVFLMKLEFIFGTVLSLQYM